MTDIKFSVVIPTRERASTLRHSLRTCLDQTFDDFEVIVSDNHSSPATRAVVDEAGSPRVRYVRTPGPLAMSSSWEFGLSHARGQYVILIGDDDGLLPHALAELDKLTRQSSLKAIRWDSAYYTWPSFAIPGQANFLRVPFGRGLREVDTKEAIRAVIEFREFYTLLPMLYNAAIHRDVLAEMRAKTGRLIPHAIPDVYTGFAAAAVAGRYLSTDVPMTVSGQSGASNGIATLFNRGRSGIDQEFRDFNAREKLLPDPRVPDLPSFPHVPVADAFLYAKKQWFPDWDVDLDRRKFVGGCVANLRVSNQGEWQWAMGLLRESLADDPETLAWFEEGPAKTPFRVLPAQLTAEELGLDGEFLHLDVSAFGVHDVAAAAALYENLVYYRRHGVEYLTGEIAEHKGISRATLELIDYLRMRVKELERGGPLKRAGRWVKHSVLGTYHNAREFVTKGIRKQIAKGGISR